MSVRKWIWPLLLVSVVIFVISLRQLSDPDLGSHLKYGKWIVTNLHTPVTDQSTYTVAQHPYVDLHWLFQVLLYGVFRFTGYSGISIFICCLSLFLSILVLIRLRLSEIPVSIIVIALLVTYLLIEPRIAPRPEIFTFLFMSGMLLILDLYTEKRKTLLYLLPVIMLLWCNMHALFILGLIILLAYFFSLLIREKTVDRSLLVWMILSFLVCFINPYGIKGFAFPVELLSRFNPDNIFKQHIQEFISFFSQPRFVIRDYLFLAFLGVTVVFSLLTFDLRKLHSYFLLVLFGFLAISSIRNIPLFVLIAVPVVCKQTIELLRKIKLFRRELGITLYILMIILPLALIPRLITNAYYQHENSFALTGIGIDKRRQPADATAFLLKNHLDGRMLNSIGFGGWLSWTLPQPIFMDGRLEVMQEATYRKITESWNGGLTGLISEYQPQLIIYNYHKYYPWTFQLKDLPGWRLIYADCLAAIFVNESYAKDIPTLDLSTLSSTGTEATFSPFNLWIQGFYRQPDFNTIDNFYRVLFRNQMSSKSAGIENQANSITFYNSANLKFNKGDISGALADYDTAIAINQGYSKAYNNRGILRASALKDYRGAIADFTKAIELNPGYGDAFLGRGTAYFLMQNGKLACKDWNSARLLGNEQAARLIELHCSP